MEAREVLSLHTSQQLGLRLTGELTPQEHLHQSIRTEHKLMLSQMKSLKTSRCQPVLLFKLQKLIMIIKTTHCIGLPMFPQMAVEGNSWLK